MRILVLSFGVALAGCATTGGLDRVAPEPAGFQDGSPCSDVKPTSRIAPKYPRGAARAGQPGWVALKFNITPGGETSNVRVVDSSPAGLFDSVSITALEQWRYPSSDNGHTECRQLLSYSVKKG